MTPRQSPTATLERVVVAILTADPTGERSAAIDAVLAVTRTHRGRAKLDRELSSNPTRLTGADPSLSLPAQHLVRALATRGFTQVAVPACPSCQRLELLTGQGPGEVRLCDNCSRHAKAALCSTCGTAPGQHRRSSGAFYCDGCKPSGDNRHSCATCGSRGTLRGNGTNRQCRTCSPASFPGCHRCGDGTTNIRYHQGQPICPSCYRAMRTTPRPCAACRERRLLPYRVDGRDVCATCAGHPAVFACTDCGSDADAVPGQYCPHCLLARAVDRLLSGPDGRINPRLLPLRGYLLDACTRPATLRRWLSQAGSARIVRAMARGDLEVSLDAIARLPQTPTTGYTAALLQTAGVVPTANFERLRLEVWETDALDRMSDPAARRIARQYASWVLNPRFATTDTASPVEEWQRHHGSKRRLRAVISLLEMVDARGKTLATFPQRDYDGYVGVAGRDADHLAVFLAWARTRHLTVLSGTPLPARSHRPALGDDERRAAARALLHDRTLDTGTRLIGLLAVTYGISIARLVGLPLDRISSTAQAVTITFGVDPLHLPDKIAALARDHLAQADSPFRNQQWVFPGRRPGEHLAARSARRRLSSAGIETSAAQTSALLSLARSAPAAVLADLLGISASRAATLATAAGRDWVDYPRLRQTAAEAEH